MHAWGRAAHGGPGAEVEVATKAPASHTVVLADNQPAIRHGVRSILERAGDIAVVGEAATAAEALAETARHRPDVLMMDVQLETAGSPVISRAVRAAPGTGVLVFSDIDDAGALSAAIRAGARGYLIKDAGPDQIVRGIQAVAAGEVIIGRAIAERFGALFAAASGTDSYPFAQLTNRERDVLERVAAGMSNPAIARDLALSPKTVSNRVSAIFGKLGTADRAQVIVLAREAGLGRGR
ncbi:response regulator transcription factor [Amycolatopsis samaneae]